MLLDIIPKVTASGKVILKSLGTAANTERNKEMKKVDADFENGNSSESKNVTSLEMKAYRVEYALNEVLGYLGETDIVLGQGLRGQLGASAPAQIQILSSLAEATKEFDELIRAVPEKI